MLRVLLIAVAVVVLIAMLRGTLRRMRGDGERSAAPPPAPAEPARLEEMVACAHCGVHLPRGDAVAAPDGTLFCGEPHRLARAQGRPPQR